MILDGGEINITDKVLAFLQIPKEEMDFIKDTTPERTITNDSVTDKDRRKDMQTVYAEEFKKWYDVYFEMYTRYLNNGKLSNEDLDKVSFRAFPMTNKQFKRLSLLDLPEARAFLSKFSIEKAYDEVTAKYHQARLKLIEAVKNPKLRDYERDKIQKDIEYYKDAIVSLKDQRDFVKEKLHPSMTQLITITEKARLRTIGRYDRTDEIPRQGQKKLDEAAWGFPKVF